MDNSNLKHEMISELQRVVAEIGRVPSRPEFPTLSKITRHQIEVNFGSWTLFKQAAGMDSDQKKITNAIFEKNIEEHLENYEPRKNIDRGPWPTGAFISDEHRPFVNQRVVDRFVEYVGDCHPEWVCEVGDGDDYYSHSRFPRSHNIFLPKEERALSRKLGEDLWARLTKASPNSKRRLLLGNHQLRPMKQILESYPEAEDWVMEGLKKDLTFDGVETVFDHREELFIADDIIVFHGYRTGVGKHRDSTLLNCVTGHTHKGYVHWKRVRGQSLFELGCGFAGDPEAKGLTYTPQKIMDYTPGFGIIDKYGPQFVSV